MAVTAIVLATSNGVRITENEAITLYLQKIVDEFKKNPEDGRYLNIINPPANGKIKSDFFLPKIFIWSPQEQFPECKIICPVHKCLLKPGKFTSDTARQDKMQRLIFDLFGNVLLV